MALLKRDEILQAADIQKEIVPVPEWGGEVMVYGLDGVGRDQFESSIIVTTGKKQIVKMENVRAKLCALAIRDENGERLFSDADVMALGKKSAAALQRVFDVAQRLSGLGENDIEELAKN